MSHTRGGHGTGRLSNARIANSFMQQLPIPQPQQHQAKRCVLAYGECLFPSIVQPTKTRITGVANTVAQPTKRQVLPNEFAKLNNGPAIKPTTSDSIAIH